MIPKIIHYCWFGGEPLPDLAVKCLTSWKKFFPDYEIKEWNESNFDFNCCEYVKEAYETKKWAFVSDYARFLVLYNYGGLYFDTDVEVIMDMSDIVAKGSFMGCESSNELYLGLEVNPGLGLGVTPRHALYKEILDSYEKSHFLNQDGSNNYITVVDRTTQILKSHGFKNTNELQQVANIHVYPKDYFCPLDYISGKLMVTENTKSIHWYDASWLDNRMKNRRKNVGNIRKMFHGKSGVILSKIYMSCSYYWEWISTGEFNTIKQKINTKLHIKNSKHRL